MSPKSRITDAIDLLSRARLKLETAAECVGDGQGDKALDAVREVLADVRGELRTRADRLQALVIAATADAPVALHLFDGVFASMRSYQLWVRDGMEHCYVEGKLCARPSIFFAEVAKRATPTTDRGKHFRQRAGEKGEKPVGVTRDPPKIPVPVASAGDAPRQIQIPTGRKPRTATTTTTTP